MSPAVFPWPPSTPPSAARRRWLCVALCLALALSTLPRAVPVQAQGETPTWMQNLKCDPALNKYQGLALCTGPDGKNYVVVVDLWDPQVRFEYVIAQGKDRNGVLGPCRDVNIPSTPPKLGPGCSDPNNPNYYPVLSLSEAVMRYPDAAVVINSDYGAGTQGSPGEFRGHGPEGFTVVQGKRLDGSLLGDTDNNAVMRPWLAIGQNPLRVEFGQLSTDDGSAPGWIYTGMGGAPWLIKGGEIQREDSIKCKNANLHSCESTEAQTAVGLSQDGRWLFWVITQGQNALQTADFMRNQLGAWQAIKLDGGGSSQLYYSKLAAGNQTGITVRPGDGRKLSQYLAIFAQPGSGIVIPTQPPVPSPTPIPPKTNWWDTLLKSIQDGWNNFWNNAFAQLNRWFQEQQRSMAERMNQWWQQMLTQLLNQLCGVAWLPFAVGGVWVLRRRQTGRRR